MDKRHYVYLLRCADGSLYTGMTPDIARRLRQHVEHLAGPSRVQRSQTTSPTRKPRQTPERLPGLSCLWFSAGRAAPDSGA